MTWDIHGNLTGIQGKNISYTYLSDGQRYTKTVKGVQIQTTYHYNNGMLLSQTTGDETIRYYYDSDGAVTELGYQKGDEAERYYFFARNGWGDVIALYRSKDSALIGTYEYDAWGRPISVTEAKEGIDTDGMLTKNPFRYRGYYYDEETGFYYLNARYYDPEIRRFISADDRIAGVSEGVSGYNLFAYCENDPVNKNDASGCWPDWNKIMSSSAVKKALIGTAVIAAAAVVTVATGGAGAPAAVAAVHCFAAGALQGAVAGAAIGAVSGAVTNAAFTYVTTGSVQQTQGAFLEGAADGFMWGAIGGAVSGGVGSMNCFVAGTMVCTIQGSIPIEEIQPGDYVLSTDPETGDTTYKMVLETYENTAEELVHISVGEENFVTTTGHPFYVENRGWTEAGELKREDNLLLSTGEWVEISNIETEFPEEAVTVYNFAVEDYHTYHVGESGVLVHNACGIESGTPSGKYQVGAYQDIKGVEGLDAHHVGQKAVMKNLVENYDPKTAPAINVPKVGHTIFGPNGIVSRNTKGIDNARQLLARDLFELKRVYPDIPNSSYRELIDMNMKMYPEMRK